MKTATSRPDYLHDTRNIFGFAAFLSAGFALVGYIGEALQVVNYSLLPAALCGTLSFLVSVASLLVAPRVSHLRRLIKLDLVVYILIATIAIHFAGGPQSFLISLYIGITVAAAFLTGRRGAMLTALMSFACFSALMGLEYSGVLPTYPIWERTLSLESRGAILGGLIFSMAVPTFIVAYVAGTLADRIARRTAEQAALATISRDITASLNPDEVIRMVLKRAIENTPSDRGGIHLFDSDRRAVRVVAVEGEGFEPWAPPGSPIWPAEIGLVGRVLRTGQSVRLGEVSHDPDYFAAAPESRSELCVPILQDNSVEGAINLESNRPHAYSDADQRFVEQLAQQAAVALFNAQLYARTEGNLYEVAQANLRVRALQESLSAVQSTLELGQILQRICDAIVSLGYDVAILSTLERDTQRVAVRAAAANDPRIIEGIEAVLGFKLVGMSTKLRLTPRARNIGIRALAERRVLVSNLTADFLYPIATIGARAHALEEAGLRIGAAIPLVVRNAPLGVLYAFSGKPELTEMDLSSLQAFGAQAAVALDKANLFEEARTVRDRLQAVLDATHDGLIFFDTQTRMVLTNRAAEQLLGVSLAAHLGQPMGVVLDRVGLIDMLYPGLNPEERQAVIDTEVNVMTTGLRDGSSEVARRLIAVPGPETRYVEEFSIRVVDEQNELVGRLVALHDVTDQKQLETDRDAVTQMLVHDLRSPLSAIIGSLQLIELGLKEGDSAEIMRRSVEVAMASGHKLLNLIGSLLDVQRLETGQIQLQLQALSPASLIHDAVEALQPLAETSEVSLDAEANHDLPSVSGDAEHIRRVLTNLVDNAIKFVGTGGRVRVSAASGDGYVRFSVADNGPGIPPEYRDRIFERYVQVPGHTGKRRGSGLGLTYCKMVVEMHGGRIWVESPPPGGSDFLFTLPISPGLRR